MPVDVVTPVAHRSAHALPFQEAAQAHFHNPTLRPVGPGQIIPIDAAIAKKRDRLCGPALVIFLFRHEGGCSLSPDTGLTGKSRERAGTAENTRKRKGLSREGRAVAIDTP